MTNGLRHSLHFRLRHRARRRALHGMRPDHRGNIAVANDAAGQTSCRDGVASVANGKGRSGTQRRLATAFDEYPMIGREMDLG